MTEHLDYFGNRLQVGDKVHVPRDSDEKNSEIWTIKEIDKTELVCENDNEGMYCIEPEFVIKAGTIFTRSEVANILSYALSRQAHYGFGPEEFKEESIDYIQEYLKELDK